MVIVSGEERRVDQINGGRGDVSRGGRGRGHGQGGRSSGREARGGSVRDRIRHVDIAFGLCHRLKLYINSINDIYQTYY